MCGAASGPARDPDVYMVGMFAFANSFMKEFACINIPAIYLT